MLAQRIIKQLLKSNKFVDLVIQILSKQADLQEDEYEEYWKDYIEETKTDEDRHRTLAIALFESQRNTILNQMTGSNDVIQDVHLIQIWLFGFSLIWENSTVSAFYNSMLRTTVDTGKWSSNYLNLDLPEGFSVTNPNIMRAVREHVNEFATQITDTTKSLLEESLREGILAGESLDIIRQRVNFIFDNAVENRAGIIATNETMWAGNYGITTASSMSNVQKKAWFAALDERTCTLCLNMYERYGPQTGGISINANFGNMPYPPLHPLCRCVVLPLA